MSTFEAVAKILELAKTAENAIRVERGLVSTAKMMEEVGGARQSARVATEAGKLNVMRPIVDSEIVIPELAEHTRSPLGIGKARVEPDDEIPIPPAYMIAGHGRGGPVPIGLGPELAVDRPSIRSELPSLSTPEPQAPALEASWFRRGSEKAVAKPTAEVREERRGLDRAVFGRNTILANHSDGSFQLDILEPPANNPDGLEAGSVFEIYPRKPKDTPLGPAHSIEYKPSSDVPKPEYDSLGRLSKVTTREGTGLASVVYHGDTNIPRVVTFEDKMVITIPSSSEPGPIRIGSIQEPIHDQEGNFKELGKRVGIKFRGLDEAGVHFDKVDFLKDGPQRMLTDRFFTGSWDKYKIADDGKVSSELAHYHRRLEGREVVYRNTDPKEPNNHFIGTVFAKGEEMRILFGDGILSDFPGAEAHFVSSKLFANESRFYAAADRSSYFEAGKTKPTLKIGSQDPVEFETVFRREDGLTVYSDADNEPTLVYPGNGQMWVAKRGETPYAVPSIVEHHPDGVPNGDLITKDIDISAGRTRFSFSQVVLDVNHVPIQEKWGPVSRTIYPISTIPGTTTSTFDDAIHTIQTHDGSNLQYVEFLKSRTSLDEPKQPLQRLDPSTSIPADGYFRTPDGRNIFRTW